MEQVLLRFSQIGEEIFEFLDEKSLESCRKVCKQWKSFIENPNQKFRWIKIIENFEKLITLKNWISTPFAWSKLKIQNLREFAKCLLLLGKMESEKREEMFLEKYIELKIELNTKSAVGCTPFHLACRYGDSKIAEIMMKNCNRLKIDLNAQNKFGDTGFHLACEYGGTLGHIIILEQILDHYESLKINLRSKNYFGKTGFQIASEMGRIQVVNMILRKVPLIT